MKPPIVTFPRIGKVYTDTFIEMLTELRIEVRIPKTNSEKTIKFGVKHSSDMICFPFKCSLGNYHEALESGADTLLMWDTKGRCRLRQYWKIQHHILNVLGYKDFRIIPIRITNMISKFHKLNPNNSYLKVFLTLRKYYKKLKEYDREREQFKEGKINIGIIGEIFTCLEESINYNIEQKFHNLDTNPVFTVTMSAFIREQLDRYLHIGCHKKKYKKKAKKYFNGPLGGHSLENVYNTLWLIDNGIDGIVHLLPLSCMPETTIEPIIDSICQEKDIPILRLPIDETNSEANVDTRVEAFTELIRRRKK